MYPATTGSWLQGRVFKLILKIEGKNRDKVILKGTAHISIFINHSER